MSSSMIATVLQLIVGVGLLNVWLVRSRSATAYRGGSATSLREEFAVYGLPVAAYYVVGVLKVGAAVVLIAGLRLDALAGLPVRTAAGVVAALMVGALLMHVKVGDPVKKAVPATLMLAMSVTIAVLSA